MALTPFRWLSLAAIGCMLAIAICATVTERVSRTADRYIEGYYPDSREAIDTAERRLDQVAGRTFRRAVTLAVTLRLQQVMDSVRRVASRRPDTGATRVFISEEFSPSLRGDIEAFVRRARAEKDGSEVPVDVFFVNDTAHRVRGVERPTGGVEVRYEVPAQPGDRCRVYVRSMGQPSGLRTVMRREVAQYQLMGPCGFYAAFGQPGPQVKEWLLAQGAWRYSVGGSWTTSPRPIVDGGADPRIFQGFDPILDALNVESGAPACLKGELDECAAAASFWPARRRATRSTYVVTLGGSNYADGGLGYLGRNFLSDAVRELGPDRFRSFWTSPEPIPAAFEQATGESWPAFLRRWMISRYGQLDAGPSLSWFALAMGGLLVAMAIALTMIKAANRQYV